MYVHIISAEMEPKQTNDIFQLRVQNDAFALRQSSIFNFPVVSIPSSEKKEDHVVDEDDKDVCFFPFLSL